MGGVTGAKHRIRAGGECETGVNTHELFDATAVGVCAGVNLGVNLKAKYFDNNSDWWGGVSTARPGFGAVGELTGVNTGVSIAAPGI